MTVAPEAGPWQLDASASTVAVGHRTIWGLVNVKGTFGTVTGSGELQADGSVTGTVELDAASIDTKNAKRDTHLRSADFFDVEKHPEITFAVLGAKVDGDAAELDGQLTVRGVSKPRAVPAKVTRTSADEVTLDVEFTVDRGDFGITWNQLRMMGGLTTVTGSLRFSRVK
ncbi:YceI family protein [Streptomyces sp. NPDC050738]|uniref:YceI family protein n=1 Tax=Streptomyces sp. NPDC050738 TaxID=3154744 RepID=UPI003445FC18